MINTLRKLNVKISPKTYSIVCGVFAVCVKGLFGVVRKL